MARLILMEKITSAFNAYIFNVRGQLKVSHRFAWTRGFASGYEHALFQL